MKIFLFLFLFCQLTAAPYLLLHTSEGDLVAELYPDVAPQTVRQICKLARAGLYDTTPFFRLERNFVLQTAVVQSRSLPLTMEQRNLIHPIPGEFSQIEHQRGVLSMGRQDNDPDSAESSFSILLADAPHLDGKYTIFGRLVDGWETLRKIELMPRNARNEPTIRIEIRQAKIVEKKSNAKNRNKLRCSQKIS